MNLPTLLRLRAPLVALFAALAAISMPAEAQALYVGAPRVSASLNIGIGYYGGYYGGHRYHRGPRGGLWWGPVWPGAVWVVPGPVVSVPPAVMVSPAPHAQASDKPEPVLSARAAAPDPIVYPRNGQSAEQTEADQRECNRWATTQRNAMNDASVFHRAVLACLDGRGYTVR
ncbi:hypothetical protein [Ideonella sp. BN130291]|uniref:hypothetical protein n=1 Tax=Ideonella sp. BN130291 TaxID=3112940 RepID=UPI002E252950|nr:hypothetical protein [Ideonella sp. BN130291]